jgi:hypothetical protein
LKKPVVINLILLFSISVITGCSGGMPTAAVISPIAKESGSKILQNTNLVKNSQVSEIASSKEEATKSAKIITKETVIQKVVPVNPESEKELNQENVKEIFKTSESFTNFLKDKEAVKEVLNNPEKVAEITKDPEAIKEIIKSPEAIKAIAASPEALSELGKNPEVSNQLMNNQDILNLIAANTSKKEKQ